VALICPAADLDEGEVLGRAERRGTQRCEGCGFDGNREACGLGVGCEWKKEGVGRGVGNRLPANLQTAVDLQCTRQRILRSDHGI
jgi:hypothetical protein